MIDRNSIYTPQEAADILKVSVQTVIRELKSPDSGLEGFKAGNQWRIHGESLSEYMRSGADDDQQ